MSIFKIEGNAKRKVVCDMATIRITFKASGRNAYEVSQKVMKECDEYLDELGNIGINLEKIEYDEDSVVESRYDNDKVYAERSIIINIPFEMKMINYVQTILQNGKYDYELDIDACVSNRKEVKRELTKEALLDSKKEAEQIAEALGIQLKGIDSICKDCWDDEDEIEEEMGECEVAYPEGGSRTSDSLGAKMIEEKVTLIVKWILE